MLFDVIPLPGWTVDLSGEAVRGYVGAAVGVGLLIGAAFVLLSLLVHRGR